MTIFDASSGGRAADARARRSRAAGLRMRTAVLVIMLSAAAVALSATDAAALIVRVGGRTLGYQPLSGAAAPQVPQAEPLVKPLAAKALEYHGGPVMPSNTNYTLYWDPAGAPAYPAGYESGINRYFEDLAHDSGGVQNTDSVLTQYGDSGGELASYDSHFGGALIDTDAYPANGCSAAPICLTDEQLRTEIAKYTEAHKLPADLQHEYFVLTPPGVESCFEAAGHSCSAGASHAAYCSYHSYISVAKGMIVYANTPYMDGTNCDTGEEHPNGNASDATLGGGLVHEHSESVTDPELNAWYDAKGEEVADKCRTFKSATEFGEPLGKAPDGSNYNQVIDGDLYWYQQEWSNEAGACEQRSAQLPSIKKVTPKKGPASGGTAVSISGAGFAAPASVKFGDVLASEVTIVSSTSITAVSPAGSPGAVDITVTTPVGTSAIVKKDRFKYKKVR
jgi:IPT/TIG domain